jgi:hypothetical protein
MDELRNENYQSDGSNEDSADLKENNWNYMGCKGI